MAFQIAARRCCTAGLNRVSSSMSRPQQQAKRVFNNQQRVVQPINRSVLCRFASSIGAPEGADQIPKALNDDLGWGDQMVKRIGLMGGFYSKKQTISRSARHVYLECCAQAAKPELYQICGLPDTFQSWFLVQQLYVWMLCVRSVPEGDEGKMFHKQLVQFFWQDVDHRLMLMKIEDLTIKSESKRELSSMFYGLLFAYDEGLATNDQVLAAAIWRNLFHHKKSQANAEDLAKMVGFIRKEIYDLDQVNAASFLEEGDFKFGDPPSHT